MVKLEMLVDCNIEMNVCALTQTPYNNVKIQQCYK